jgi:hypothetical protein
VPRPTRLSQADIDKRQKRGRWDLGAAIELANVPPDKRPRCEEEVQLILNLHWIEVEQERQERPGRLQAAKKTCKGFRLVKRKVRLAPAPQKPPKRQMLTIVEGMEGLPRSIQMEAMRAKDYQGRGLFSLVVRRGRQDSSALRNTVCRLQALADQLKMPPRKAIAFIQAVLKAARIAHYPGNRSKLKKLMVNPGHWTFDKAYERALAVAKEQRAALERASRRRLSRSS